MLIIEIILIGVFAYKNLWYIGPLLLLLSLLALIILFYPVLGAWILITLVFSNLASVTAEGLFKYLVFYCFGVLVLSLLIHRENLIKDSMHQFIGLFIICGALSIVFAIDQLKGLEALSIFIKSLMIYFIVINTIKRISDLKIVFLLIIISASINAIVVIQSYLSGGLLTIRATGLKEDPNNMALVFVCSIPYIIPFIKKTKNIIYKLIFLLCFTGLSISVALTYSRGGLLGLFFVLFIIMYRERHNKIIICILSILLGIGLYLFAIYFAESKSLIRLISQDPSFLQRLRIFKGGLEMFKENWLLGVGLGNFIVWSKLYADLILGLYAHNIFLHIAAETGIAGLFAYSMILLKGYKNTQFTGKENIDSDMINMAAAIHISLLGFLFCGLFLSQHFNKVLWIILALSVSIKHLSVLEAE